MQDNSKASSVRLYFLRGKITRLSFTQLEWFFHQSTGFVDVRLIELVRNFSKKTLLSGLLAGEVTA